MDPCEPCAFTTRISYVYIYVPSICVFCSSMVETFDLYLMFFDCLWHAVITRCYINRRRMPKINLPSRKFNFSILVYLCRIFLFVSFLNLYFLNTSSLFLFIYFITQFNIVSYEETIDQKIFIIISTIFIYSYLL